MIRRIVTAVVLVAATAVVPGTGGPAVAAGPGPGAHAWLLRVSAPGAGALEVGDVDSRIGDTPTAAAIPFVGGGQNPFGVLAPQPGKDRVTGSGPSWSDPTGSMTLKAAYGEAWATAQASSARASLTAATGTGIVLASKLLTWDQQEQLGNELLAINSAVIDPINARLASLAPVAAMAGIQLPQFEKLGALGLIDIGGGELADATADVASSVGYASSKAAATVAHVRLFGGFIEAASLSVTADSETSEGTPVQRAVALVSNLKVAGVPVTIDGNRVAVAGNSALERSTLQPALDLLLAQLAQHGLTLKLVQQSGPGATQAATALEVDMASPALTVSLGHAEVSPPQEQPAPAAGLSSGTAPPPAAEAVESSPPVPEATPTELARGETAAPAAVPVTRASAGSGLTRRSTRLPRTVVRALGATFLILLFAGAAGGLMIPMFVTPAWRRRPSTARR